MGGDVAKKKSTVRFQVLSQVYSVLGDERKKKLYDEYGVIEGDDDAASSNVNNWEKYWHLLFRKISKQDIDEFFKSYKNSDEEKVDLVKFYEKHRGYMSRIMDKAFSEDSAADEGRFRTIIRSAIENNEVKSYARFISEDKKKAEKRKVT